MYLSIEMPGPLQTLYQLFIATKQSRLNPSFGSSTLC
uniref:Uncharacterized protein n=1 Tax=Anguilla anguilla TaxID=7936 RepID=A0A0E9VQ40_ANGAN